jgi:hypothetical protein
MFAMETEDVQGMNAVEFSGDSRRELASLALL